MATCNFSRNPAPFPIWAISNEAFEAWGDEIREDLERVNADLRFWRAALAPGYYEGAQLTVRLIEDPRELYDEECRELWDLGKVEAERASDAEAARLLQQLERVAEAHGMQAYRVLGIMSDGSAVYETIE